MDIVDGSVVFARTAQKNNHAICVPCIIHDALSNIQNGKW